MSTLTDKQKQILKFFEQQDKKVQYEPIRQIYLSDSLSTQPLKSTYPIQPLILQIQYEDSEQADQLRTKLINYKQKSMIVEEVGNLVYDYEKSFKSMLEQRNYLMSIINDLNKETSDLVSKQKKYIDISMAIKQSLDYYLYIDKFEFNWTCEPAYREMFEDQLQPMISQLTDAIQFFTNNSYYSNSKKYLSQAISSRTKVNSFTKSFFIKLLNKQYTFCFKNVKIPIWEHISQLYPKSKIRFVHQFISLFPQFKRNLRNVIMMVKENATEEEVNALQAKQLEIEDFELNENSFSLIGYLQRNIPEIYGEAILKFISYYRISFHENLYKNIKPDHTISFQETFRECYIQIAYILSNEAAYLTHLFKTTSQTNKQYLRITLSKIAEFYKLSLSRLAKDPSKNKNPILLCNLLHHIYEQIEKFFTNYLSGRYETYVLGTLFHYLKQVGVDFVKNLIIGIGKKIQHDVEAVCHNFLPKFQLCSERDKVTEQVKLFVEMIPNLKYCTKQAEKYLVTTLDIIIKSVKEASSKIQSRMQSYAWNLEIFAAIEEVISQNHYNLIKKEMRLEMNEASSLVERIKNIQRGQNFLQYTSEVFSVIKTGVPTLNQLTLDFRKFIEEYHVELRQKFIKDMVFIHSKNMIQFLQKLKQTKDSQKTHEICELSFIKNLYSTYILSIQNFISQSKLILKEREKFTLYLDGETNLRKIIKEVEEILMDLMSTFYIETSKHSKETDSFESIADLRDKFNKLWMQQ